MRRVLLLPVLAALLALSLGRSRAVEAAEGWSFDDPIIIVDGQLIDIRVQLPLTSLLTMRSTTLTVTVPQNVSAAVVVDDISAFPMKTTVSRTGPVWNGKGRLPFTVTTMVASATDFPIKVTATPLVGLNAPLLGLLSPLTGTTNASGAANTPVVMPMSLAR